MSEQNQMTVAQPKPRASQILATLMGMEASAMLDTIKAQCFKGNPQNISDAQLAAFVSIAAEMGVNPLLPGMLYAFPIQGGGIVPMMGPDGVYKKLTEHPDVDSWETTVYPEDVSLPPTHATTRIYRKGRERPLSYTALLSEWKVASNPNWGSRTRHMLGLRSLKQCARQIIHGVPYDEDERVIMGAINVTPGADGQPATEPMKRAEPKPRAKTGAASVAENPPAKTAAESAPASAPTGTKGQTVDGELMPGDPATSPVVQEAREEKRATPEPTPKETPVAPVQRAKLAPDEKITVQAKVISVVTGFSPKDNLGIVEARVDGGFYGPVYHFGGAALPVGDADPVPDPKWTVGNVLRLTLFGHKLKSGVVQPRVLEAEIAAPAKPSIETE